MICCSFAQSYPTFCHAMDCSMPGFPVLFHLPELSHTNVHRVSNAIQPLHPLSSPSPPAFNLSQHQGLFQWVGSLSQVAKVLELQRQSFQWIFRVDLFRIDWFDLLLIQGTLKSLLQRCSSEASVLQCSAFFMVQLSHPYMITGLSGCNLNRVAGLCFLIGSEVGPVHLIVLIVLWGNSALQWMTTCWSNY